MRNDVPARWRWALRYGAMALVAMVLAACGSSGFYAPLPSTPAVSPEPGSSSGAPAQETTAWELALAGFRRDGTVPLETALAAFAVAFGPLPGVATPAGEPGFEGSGSGPLRWVLGDWPELSAEQQRAVLQYIDPNGPTAGTTGSEPGPRVASAGGPPPRETHALAADLATFQATLDQVKPQMETKLKRKLKVPVELVFRHLPVKDGEVVFAVTVPIDSSGAAATASSDRMIRCQIQVNTRGQQFEGDELFSVVAHELFHCFQYDLPTKLADSFAVPAWLAEGAAAWVGEEFTVAGSTVGQQYWTIWLKTPNGSLFARAYDAIGFYAHLADSTIDPWPLLDGMHIKAAGSGGSSDAYLLAAAAKGGDKMVDTWGPSYVRDTGLGPDWTMNGKAYPDFVRTPLPADTLVNDEHVVVGLGPVSAHAFRLDVSADVMVLQGRLGRGTIRFADGSEHTVQKSFSVPFCLKPGGCACPTGEPGAAHSYVQAPAGAVLFGFSGHIDGVEIDVLSFSASSACAQAPEDFAAPSPCLCPPGPLGWVDPNGDRRRG